MTGLAISAVAFCPHPPLLRPAIATGIEIETQSLRSACNAALDRLFEAGPSHMLVVGADGPLVDPHDFAPGRIAGHRRMPLSLLVGTWLLSARTLAAEPMCVAIGPDGEPVAPWPELTGEVGVLVMGDGSARRSLKGPGYLDERAEPFDAIVVEALAAGSARSLAELDLGLAAELLVAGAPAWKAAARLLGLDSGWRTDVRYADAPFGVMYVVASWLPA